MDDLTPSQKEKIARLWCSKENDNMELTQDWVTFWDDDDKLYPFEFDIASHPRRKEIKELNFKIKQYKEQNGKINDATNNRFLMRMAKLYGISPSTPDRREVIGMVKSGKHKSNRSTYYAILGDCFLLTRAKAAKKYMILTDKETYNYFQKRCKGILGEITLVYLDPNKYKHLLDRSQ